jgi:MFS transporter, SHS family, sialic acid transporter
MQLTQNDRLVVLFTAFLGWMCAGITMAIAPLVGRAATASMLGSSDEANIGVWFSRYVCSFLLGAATGGLIFGWLGDRIGRSKAMAASILCYSVFIGFAYFAETPIQFTALQFVACWGVGGMWPTGVALVSEAWHDVSRPLLAGLIGAAANLGFIFLSILAQFDSFHISPDNWRWVMIVGSTPAILGLFALFAVPESPRWQATRHLPSASLAPQPVREVLLPPILKYTLLGMCLGAIPQMGNWGSANWTVPWAAQVGGALTPTLVATTQLSKSSGGAIGALIGGWIASQIGRRTTYFLLSLITLCTSYITFRFSHPLSSSFQMWVFLDGFFGTLYFGWLPLYLPELFPTRVRSTGNGISFNFGRILTAIGVLGTGTLMRTFDGDYSRVGQTTCLIYVLGMVVIAFAPDTSTKQLQD